jgi:hypothetical protein
VIASADYVLRMLFQGIHYSLSTRRATLLALLLLAPVIVAVAAVAGAGSPFFLYPFV